MLRQSTYPSFLRIVVVVVFLLGGMSSAVGQTNGDADQSNSIIQSYSNYADAKYAVRWVVDPARLVQISNIVPRYGYLILYTSDAMLSAPSAAQVQFGFFKSKREADQFVKEHGAAFKGLHTVSVSQIEHKALFESSASGIYWLRPGSDVSRSEIQPLFRRAKDAYVEDKFTQSLALYSALSLSGDQASRVWAQELAAVNFERSGRKNEAIAVYRNILAKNPEGSWKNRIQQRLRALESAADDGKQALRKSKYENDIKDFYWRGIFGQTYSQLTQSRKGLPDRDALSVISTHYDFTAGTTKWRGHELETRLSGYDIMDLQEYGDNAKTRLKRLYLSYTHLNSGFNIVGGRQRDDEAGVFGYFDGGSIKYPLFNEKVTIGAKAGVPVRFSDFYDSMDHVFMSLYGNYQINEKWLLSAYFNHQTLYDEVDRAAYGGKAQYVDKKLSTSLLADYDYEFAELNLVRWDGNYHFNEKSRVSANYGMQRSPFLSASNIKVGQPYLNVEEYLKSEYNQRYLKYYALERTSTYEYGSLSYHHKVDEDFHLSANFYQSQSTDVPVFESEDGWITTDVAYHGLYRYSSFGVQAVSMGFFAQNDVATMSYRYGDTTFATINTLNFSERLKLGKSFYLNPVVGLRQSKNKTSDASQTRIRASLAFTYKPWRNVELRLEGGNEAVEDVESKNSVSNTFFYAGYQARF